MSPTQPTMTKNTLTPLTPTCIANGSDNEFICSEGYSENMFEGKAEQMEDVVKFITAKGFLPENIVENEVTWFYKYFNIIPSLFIVG